MKDLGKGIFKTIKNIRILSRLYVFLASKVNRGEQWNVPESMMVPTLEKACV